MARRSKKPNGNAPITAAPAATERNKDRHKPRRTVALTPEEHRLLRELAQRNKRPLLWEVRIALENHLAANGLVLKNAR